MNLHKFTAPLYFFTALFLALGQLLTISLTAMASDQTTLEESLKAVIQSPLLKKMSYGINVVCLGNNAPIFNHRGGELFGVASNMKLLTTAAALEYLGSNFEYKTYVTAYGTITPSGELLGNIVIKGSGDPNFSGRFYQGKTTAIPEAWAAAVAGRGIRRISGDIVADDTVFDRSYTNPNWPVNQLSQWYCAPCCGLSFNDNCVDITVLPSKKAGDTVSLLVEPNTAYITIVNTCTYTANKKEHGYSLYRKPGTNQISVKGKFWINAVPEKQWVTIHNPALYLATVFKEALVRNGLTVTGNPRLVNEGDLSAVKGETITSAVSTMEQTVTVTNKNSQNFYAEQILKTLGAQVQGDGTVQAGLLVLNSFMKKLGFDVQEYQIMDGCGLSKGNRLSPSMITAILAYMSKHPAKNVFYNSLPSSGVDGGLQHRIVSPKYRNKVHAKTGYIAGVSALSGYVDTATGDIIVFSFLINNVKSLSDARKIQDDVCATLANHYN
ncbi:MAG: D-alanyl-D-alanine carboxypeptidase/D-alanyl-D-alanine-endopeptidase [Planctomycetota bacterium]|mgnify:FL=1